MRLCTRHIIFLFSLSFWAGIAAGQTYVRASVDEDSILIGEPVKLSLEATIPMGVQASWFQLDSIPHFKILATTPPDTSESIDGRNIVQTLTITGFDSGQWQIPPLSIQVDGKAYTTTAIPVTVAFTPFNPAQDYHDIREIIEVPNPYTKYIPWVIALVTLVAIGLAVYLLRGKEEAAPAPPPVVVLLSPYEEAMKALKALREKGTGQNGQVKGFYTQLNDILRTYLDRQLRVSALKKTNDELIRQLKQASLSTDLFDQLTRALQMSDFVKFAKYQPPPEENDRNFDIVRAAIQQLHVLQQASVPAEQKPST